MYLLLHINICTVTDELNHKELPTILQFDFRIIYTKMNIANSHTHTHTPTHRERETKRPREGKSKQQKVGNIYLNNFESDITHTQCGQKKATKIAFS